MYFGYQELTPREVRHLNFNYPEFLVTLTAYCKSQQETRTINACLMHKQYSVSKSAATSDEPVTNLASKRLLPQRILPH